MRPWPNRPAPDSCSPLSLGTIAVVQIADGRKGSEEISMLSNNGARIFPPPLLNAAAGLASSS
jgi:hypothetical protein